MSKADDARIISEIEGQCFAEGCWSFENVRSSLERDDTVYGIEFKGNSPAGYFLGAVSFEEAELYRVAVLPEYRRSGIGKRLMERFMESVFKAERVFLEVRESNEAAIRLYESCGFEVCGRRKKYYGNEDGLVYNTDTHLKK